MKIYRSSIPALILMFVFSISSAHAELAINATSVTIQPKIMTKSDYLSLVDYLFSKIDRKGLGYFTRENIVGIVGRRFKNEYIVPFYRGQTKFNYIDFNGDRKITRNEFQKFAERVYIDATLNDTRSLNFSDLAVHSRYQAALR